MAKDSITFLSIQDVVNKTRLARSTIYAKIVEGEFPAPIKVSKRASAWIESEVEDWAREKILASRENFS
ncbi:MAG: helix-turn-helix transcriptional regulator [Porticoccaceae bacterium]